MTYAARDPVPRERGGWWRWVWLIWAAFASICLFVSSLILLSGTTAPGERQYTGELRPLALHLEMRLPAGVPLKEIVVSADQEVAAGQTIAVLDQSLIEQEFKETGRSIFVQRALRLCLLAGPGAIPGFDASESPDSETGIRLATALQDCQALHREHALQIRRLTGARNRILGRVSLLDQREVVAVALAPGPMNKAAASASFSAERVHMTGLAGQLEHEIAALWTLLQRERIARVSDLEDTARHLELRQALLRGYLDNPRLQAPQAGKIVRARSFPDGGVFLQDAVLATLATVSEESYRVYFPLTAKEARSFKPGQEVAILLPGALNPGTTIKGHIADFLPSGPDKGEGSPVQAAVSLPDSALKKIENSKGLHGLAGAGTAAVVHIKTETGFLSALLGQMLADLMSVSALPFWR